MEATSRIEHEIEATVIRADGTRVPLRVVSSTRWRWWSRERWRARIRTYRANYALWRSNRQQARQE